MDGQTLCYYGLSSRNDTYSCPKTSFIPVQTVLYEQLYCIEKCRWLQEILKRLIVNEKHYAAIPTQPIPSHVHELTTTPSISVSVFHFFLDTWKIMG